MASVGGVLSSFDDFPIHQTTRPLAHTATTDLNHFDSYFFNGYTRDARLYFALHVGLYPNRHVADASFSVVLDGSTANAQQISVHASGRASIDRASATSVGPIRLEVLEPLDALHIGIEAPEHGVRADLTFVRRSAPIEEPHYLQQVGTRVAVDFTRFNQFGGWEGWLEIDGVLHDLSPGETLGARDRSWGIRPLADSSSAGAPVADPQAFQIRASINFDTFSTHADINELFDGKRWHDDAFVAPIATLDGAPAAEAMRDVAYDIAWRHRTRTPETFELRLVPWSGEPSAVHLEPLFDAYMAGLGHLHPTWRHGEWRGESNVDGERWDLPVDEPTALDRLHVQTVVRATTSGAVGEHEGIGVLDVLALGRHDPTGLTGLCDGWEPS